MKILFVYSNLVVDDVNGTYYHNFLDTIIKRYRPLGELTLCVSRRVCTESTQTLLDVEGVTLRFVEKENTFRKRFLDRSLNKRIVRELVDRSDWVIAHVPDSVASQAIDYAHARNVPCLAVVVGCPWDALWNHSLRGKCMAPLSYWVIRRAVGLAPFALYVTERFLQHRYPNYGENIACSDVELPVLEHSVLDHRLERISAAQGRMLTLITVGAVNFRAKGQADVLRAVAALKRRGIQVRYELIGGGDDSRLRALARSLDIEDQVCFRGIVPHERVFSLLQEADVYVQPSRTEGLPRSVVEAMACALPCLGTRVGGIPELLPDDCLYTPGDIRALMRLVKELSPGVMRDRAVRNFKRAGDFQSALLDRRRTDFLNHIKHIIENG